MSTRSPAALAKLLSERLGIPFDISVVQTNVVGHTGAGGYGRLARQAAFGGEVKRGREYVMVDDFIGQGGTLANLRGWNREAGRYNRRCGRIDRQAVFGQVESIRRTTR